MNKRKINTAVLLVAPEDELIDFALTGLYCAAVRADRGRVVPSDASIMRISRQILEGVELSKASREESTVAMIANTMEPAAA